VATPRDSILGLGTSPATPPPTPAGPPAWPGKVWTYGDCDPALKKWQLQMNRHGYGFQGTGCCLETPRLAVLDLQRAIGSTPSGKLGPRTWRAAWDGTAPTRGGCRTPNGPRARRRARGPFASRVVS
jgi:hypothetical protein